MERGEIGSGEFGPLLDGPLLKQLTEDGGPRPIGSRWVAPAHDGWVAFSIPSAASGCDEPAEAITETTDHEAAAVQQNVYVFFGEYGLRPSGQRQPNVHGNGAQDGLDFFCGGSVCGVQVKHAIDKIGQWERNVRARTDE